MWSFRVPDALYATPKALTTLKRHLKQSKRLKTRQKAPQDRCFRPLRAHASCLPKSPKFKLNLTTRAHLRVGWSACHAAQVLYLGDQGEVLDHGPVAELLGRPGHGERIPVARTAFK